MHFRGRILDREGGGAQLRTMQASVSPSESAQGNRRPCSLTPWKDNLHCVYVLQRACNILATVYIIYRSGMWYIYMPMAKYRQKDGFGLQDCYIDSKYIILLSISDDLKAETLE